MKSTIEIVEIDWIQTLLDQGGSDFERRCFTELEQAIAQRRSNPIPFFAGRFAAKQAVFRIIKEYSLEGSWSEIEIQQLLTGEPKIVLKGECLAIAEAAGLIRWFVSISHTNKYAAASVIALV